MATESLQARLTDFERQARGVCIGVNHLALDSERARQAELLQKIMQLEKDIQQSGAQKSHLPEAAAEIRDDVKNNTAALRYLETISQLENSFTVLTENVTETSVQLSSPKELKDEVHVKKELSNNVKSCWSYVSQLARLSQVHIRNAAEYHQFHHAISEVEASLKARVRMTDVRNQRHVPATLKNCTILANEFREHLNHMIHLWGRSGNLLEESRRIVPIHLRLGGIIDGVSTNTETPSPVMARMLTSLTGPNYELKEGEEVRLISNRDDQHFWTVQTNNGIVKIPSVCLWISDPDLEAVKRAVILREKCIESWDLLVERSRERLRSYYSCLLNQMAENGDIYYNNKTAMDNFLDDLRSHLLLPNDNNRTSELGQAIYAFTDRLKMADINRQRGGTVLREQDIVCMHSPLLRLRDHERQMEHLRAQSELLGTHMTNYLREIDADQKRVDNELSLIDQLQHESQSQLDQLISRVKRWSSRFEHEPNIDSSITNSRLSSSIKSSTISDNYPQAVGPTRSIVRDQSRFSGSSLRSDSIPRAVVDAITQIGVTTRTQGTQSSEYLGDIELRPMKGQYYSTTSPTATLPPPERKLMRNAITQIGIARADTGVQGDDYLPLPTSIHTKKRSVKEVLCQIGQITANASCQTLEMQKPQLETPLPLPVVQPPPKKCTLDAVVQSGVITKNNSAQCDYIQEKTIMKTEQPQQKPPKKLNILDAICQIGQVTQSIGIQSQLEKVEKPSKHFGVQVEPTIDPIHKKPTTEAICQIGKITMNASTETSPNLFIQPNLVKKASTSDITCQIGKIERTASTQTTATMADVIEEKAILHDVTYQHNIPRSNFCHQADLISRPKSVSKTINDVVCQVGQVRNDVSTQSMIEQQQLAPIVVTAAPSKPACRDTGVNPVQPLTKQITANNDVVTQTGIVFSTKIIQAEVREETQPVYVKTIETKDAPITSYKENMNACQQADLIQHILRRPTSDVVCQVGSVTETTGSQMEDTQRRRISQAATQSIPHAIDIKEVQTDVKQKLLPRPMNDVVCQVGQVRNDVSTQSVEYAIVKPPCRDTGVDPVHAVRDKVSNDVVTQTGIVHASKVTQAELREEQPVYVKTIETKDAPITSYKENMNACQQADLIQHILRRPTSDVVCQVGSVTETTGSQMEDTQRRRISQAATQSIPHAIDIKEVQTDVKQKLLPRPMNDVVCQVGQVRNDVSTQSVEYAIVKPPCRDTGVDPVHAVRDKVSNDVVTQTGIVHASKVTQAELREEQPVYVKTIETKDAPITSYKENMNACQQADLIQHILRRPTSDVVCQVGSVTETTGSQMEDTQRRRISQAATQSIPHAIDTSAVQVDMTPKLSPKAMHDVVCQVGHLKNETSTQSVEYAIIKPTCRETGVNPVQLWDKKVSNDVVTQTGLVHTSKVTETDLIKQEKPTVFMKMTETQPLPHPRETKESGQQVTFTKMAPIPRSLSDVICQVGSISQDFGVQVGDHKKESFPMATQSTTGHFDRSRSSFSAQTDMLIKFPERRSVSCYDLITQCGVVNDSKACQTIEPELHVKTQILEKTQKHIIKPQLDVVVQTGVVMRTEQTMTATTDTSPMISVGVDPRPTIPVREVSSYQAPPMIEKQNRHVQVYMKPMATNKDIQTESIMTKDATITSDLLRTPPPPIIPYEVVTQTGVLKQNIDTQTTFVEWRPVIQSTDKYVQSETVQTIPEIQTVAKRDIKYDVQTQSGIMRQSQAFQTPTIPKPTVNLRSTGIQNVMDMPQKVMKHATVETVAKQFDVKVQTESITQPRIMPMAQTTHRPTQTFDAPTQTERIAVRDQQVFTSFKTQVYDAQTQSGSTVKTQAVQTPIEQRPVIEMKELSTQHEKRPEPTVHKKLQAIVQSLTANIETQTMDYRPPPAFDVQTQSGVVRVDSESQTPIERRPVVEVKDASVYHTLESIPTVHKKLQAAVIPRLDNISTQTDPMPQPVIMPTVQTTHRPPQLLDTQTQTEGTRVRDQQSFTSFESKIFDVQTQFGSILKSQAVQTPIEQRPVIEMKELSTQHEKRPEPTVHKKLQAVVQSLTANIETQTMDYRPPPAFDVQTQSGVVRVDSESQTPIERRPVVEVKDASVYHTLESIPTVHKKLQAAVIPRLDNISTQTDPMPQPVIMPTVQTTHRPPQLLDTQTQTEGTRVRDQQSFTSFESKIFDVQTQFGSILKSQAVQTPIEQRPVIEMKELSTQHEKRPEPTVHKKLQAVVQSLTANIETQTMDYRPPPAFDVQTQSGVVRVDSESQTPIERRPVVEVKDASVYHTLESIPTVHKKLQAAVIPRLDNISTQTDPMPQPVIMPTVQTTHRPPQLLDTQTQTEGTRVRDQQSFTSFESKIFDVQTQFGSILKSQAVQTPIEQRPVIEMKELSTQHEKRPEPTVHKKLQAVVQSLTANIETQTMDYRPPPAFDVQTQSGVVRVDSESQTPIERRPVVEVKDASVYHTLESIPTVHKKLQAAVIPRLDNISTQTDPMPQPVIMPTVQTTHRPPQLLDTQTQTEGTRVRDQQSFTSFESKIFDVQTQFGSILKSQAVQTPIEQRPVIEMKELSTQHEKRPEPTVHKKLQAVVQSLTANIETQTMDYRPPPAFDVQTQSGVVRVDSESQTPIERRPVVEVKDASVYHTLESIPTVHKKLQAAVIPRLDNISTQTDPMPQPVVIPTIQTTHLPPVISDVQTQSGIIHKTQASQTVTQPKTVVDAKESCTQYEPIKTVTFSKDIQVDISRPTSHRNVQTDMTDIHIFDVQTQSGVIRKPSEAQTAPAMLDASVTHEDQRQSVNKKLQAIVQMPLKDTFVQAEMIEKRTPAMIRRETFDVQTQSGSVRCSSATQTPPVPVAEKKDLSVLHAPQATPSTNKKLQAMVTCPSDEKCLQTEDYTLPAIKPYQQSVSHAPQVVHQHVQTEFKRTTTNTFDVVTQSGTIYVAQAVQTLPEVRPVIDTSDVSVIHHRERTPSTNRKLQAAIRQSVSSTSTQTEPMKAEPMMLTKNTFDVVTQSGTIYVAQAVQTLPEVRPVVDTSDVSVIHHRERTPSTNRKLQAAIRQSVSSTSTQTEPMKAEPMMLTKNTFDVVTQSGTIYVAQAVQTLPEVRPVVDTSDVSVIHHRERTPSTNRKLQAAIRQSVSSTSTQTEPMKAEPMMSTKNTFDVVTQSGTIYVAQAVQTLPEVRPVVDTSDVSVIHHRERTPSTNRKLQAAIRQSVSSTSTQTEPMKAEPVMLTKNTFDVVTQSGTLFKSEVVQVDLVGVLATTKDLSVHHERKLADVTHRDIQVSLKIPYKHVSVQSEVADLPLGKSFNVETQCGVMRREAEAQTSTPRQVEVKDSCVQHRAELTKTVNKKLQALVTPSLNTIGSQTPELQPVTKVPVIQASRRPIETDETMTQTDALMFPEIQPVKSKKSDVQAQSGIIHKTQASQTVTQPKTVVDAKESCTQYEPIKTVTFSKDIQVDISRPTSHRNVQTDMTDIHIFDVQTQSGVIRKPSEAQTAPAMLDASVTHEDQRQSVNKKLQAIVQMPLKDTFVQAEMIEKRTPAMIRRETFDVQTQSGSVRCSSATQTPPVPVAEKKDLSVLHAPQATPSTNKKLQAMVTCPSDEKCLQTEDYTLPAIKPYQQSVSHAPQVVHQHVQTEFKRTTTNTFDVVTQSGTIYVAQAVQTLPEVRPVVDTSDVSVIHHRERTPSTNRKLQAAIRQSVSSTSTQTEPMKAEPMMLTKNTFDVVTQSGTIYVAQAVQTLPEVRPVVDTSDVSVIHHRERTPSTNRKLQAAIRQSVSSTSTQTEPMKAEPMMLTKNTFDVVTQSGTIYVAQAVQTLPEVRPVVDTSDVSVIHHRERTPSTNRKLQAAIRQSVSSTSTQTEPMKAEPMMLTKNTFDVVTQSGTIYVAQAVQTLPEVRPVVDTSDVSVIHHRERTPSTNRKLQAAIRQSVSSTSTQTEPMKAEPMMLTKNTFDVVTQSGTIYVAQAVQTLPEVRPVVDTSDVSVIHHRERTPSTNRKLQAAIRQSVSSTSTQTEPMKAEPMMLTKNTFDVVTQSGTIYVAQAVQTLPEVRPVVDTSDVSVIHHRERTPSTNRKLQAAIRQSVSSTSTQTEPMKAEPMMLTKNTFDVVTQSGTISVSQAIQTSSEYRVPSDTRDINIAYRKPASPTPELAPYTVNAEVQCQPSTCSSWIQTMRELESRPELKDASVAHKAEDLESPLIVERPRETAPSRRYTSTSGIQTDESLLTLHRSHVYDVQTESGKVVRVAGVQTDIPIHKQDVTSSTFDIQTQSGILSRDSNVQTVLPAYIHTPSYDVQLQSGIMTDYTGVQTLRYNPLVYVTQDSYYVTDERQIEETRDKSIAHIPEKPTLKGKKLQVSKNLVDSGFQVDVPQVITQPIIKSTMHTVPFQTQSTQTIQSLQTDGWCQAILTRPAYDVQTQFGVLHAVDGTQTVAMTPVAETKETTVVHEKEPIQLKGKKLQVRSSLTDSQVQTEEMTPAVLPTIASTIHAVPVSIQSVQTVEKKVAEMSCQVAVPSSAYDVQTQFGVLHAVDGTQTVAMTPVAETKETTVVHEKEPIQLKGKKLQVRSSLTDSQVQTEEMTPAVLPTIASTIHAVPVSIQSVQTVEKKVAEMSCQVAVPSSAYDVQTQFGVLHAVDGTQTVAMTPVAETKETTVVHEKEPIQLKGKKLQVRSSLTDSHCQTEQTSQYTEVKSIQTTPIQQKDSSCQYVIETIKPTSITSHTVSSQSISVQTTTDLPSLFHAQRTDQRNKKFQVNLISIPSPRTPTAISTHVTSSSTQTPSYEYKDISLEQHTEEKKAKPPTVMIHSSVSNINVTPTTTQQLQQHIIPKIKIDQECQVKISPQQYDKKLQYGQSFSSLKDVSLQYTDSFDRDQSSKVQFKNKKLQVIPSKLGSEGGEVLTHDKDVQCSPTLDEKSVKPTKQATATSTIRSQYFTRILQMDTLPEIEKNSKQTTTDDYLLERLPLFKHRSDDRDSDHDDKIKMSTSVVQLEKPTAEQCCQIDFRRNELIAAAASYHQSDIHIRDSDIVFQKRLQEPRRTPIIDSTGYYSHEYHSVGINTRFSPSTSPRTATSRTRTTPSPPSSTRSKTRSPKSPDVVSWGVQSAPVMLTGVTQTTETLKHKISLDLSISTGVQTDLPLSDAGEDDYYIKRVVTTIARKGLSSYCRRGPVTRKIIDHSDLLTSSLPSNLNVGQHEGDDEAEDQLDEEMIAVGDQLPKTSKKITTIHKHGDRRYVREELFTEDYKDRGSSLDSRLAYGAGPSGGARSLREVHLQDIDLHDMHEHDDIYTDAEICFQNLLTLWGQQYLLSRVRMIGRSTTTPELSVTLDRARSESGKSRLIEAKTQFTSTGNLVTSLKNISSVATQTTSDIPFVTRPPHKNKRIQRGHSFIAKASGSGVHQPTRTGSAVSPLSPTTEELTTIGHHRQQQQQGIAGTTTTTTTTYTETTHEQQSMLSLEQTYVCPACGNQATIPIPLHTTSIQPQVLPITQLKDAQAQTRFHEHQSQALTTDKQCTYIPVYLTDEDVIRINPSQRIEEEKEYSMVTWHPATTTETDRRRDDSRNDDRGGQDEVWIDSPGKLFELKLKEVIIPGTNKYISAGEAFYRGLLRVVYWDYEKLGGRQSSLTDSSAASIPLTDAVISKAVRLAHEKSVHPHQQAPSSLDAKIVWRTPEIQRHRYIVHSIRPPPVYPGQSRHTPITLDITSAIRTGLIDKDTGCMLFTTSVVKKGDSSGSSSEQTERLSVREAMVRGYLVAEFIQPEASRMMKTITQSSSVAYVLPSTSYTSHSPTDVDI